VPEGHTLHRLARLHQRRYAGSPVAVSSPQGRFADAATTVDGHVLRHATAWGKHLFHHYVGGATVHVHLGLYGKFTEWTSSADDGMPEPVGAVRMRMVGAEYGTDLRGPTVCESSTKLRSPTSSRDSGRTHFVATPTRRGRGSDSASRAGLSARC
jgi:endonuclease-8